MTEVEPPKGQWERLADLSAYVNCTDPPWASPAIRRDRDPGPRPEQTGRRPLDRPRWDDGARFHGTPADYLHPDPGGLTWRRFLYDDLPDVAVYAGFSEPAEVVGLFLMSVDGESPLTARQLARLSIATMRRQWRTTAASADVALAGLFALAEDGRPVAEALLDRALALRHRTRPGGAGHPDAYYAQIAVRYSRLAMSGPRPIQRLAEELGGVSDVAARNLVHLARKKGFLTPVTRGKAGGTPTPKALAALDENRD